MKKLNLEKFVKEAFENEARDQTRIFPVMALTELKDMAYSLLEKSDDEKEIRKALNDIAKSHFHRSFNNCEKGQKKGHPIFEEYFKHWIICKSDDWSHKGIVHQVIKKIKDEFSFSGFAYYWQLLGNCHWKGREKVEI